MSKTKRVCCSCVCAWSAIVAGLLIAGEDAAEVLCSNGVVTFESPTNVAGVEIKGKSSALSAGADVSADGNQLVLRNVQASVPVASLQTGMKMRDEHMRRYIFRTAAGDEPDLRFSADNATCASAGAHEYQCAVLGALEVRGASRPTEFKVKVKGEGVSYRASLDTVIKLSTFGIERPSQFGVKPTDDVKVHVEFAARAGTQ